MGELGLPGDVLTYVHPRLYRCISASLLGLSTSHGETAILSFCTATWHGRRSIYKPQELMECGRFQIKPENEYHSDGRTDYISSVHSVRGSELSSVWRVIAVRAVIEASGAFSFAKVVKRLVAPARSLSRPGILRGKGEDK